MTDTTSLSEYRQYLTRIAEQARQDAAEVGPVADDEKVAELVSAFRDAVLSLYNNTLRVCGVPVGDADSESHSVMIYDRLGRELDNDIGDGLAKARRAEIAHLEAEEIALAAEADQLRAAAEAAQQTVHSLFDSVRETAQKRDAVTKRVQALKEQV